MTGIIIHALSSGQVSEFQQLQPSVEYCWFWPVIMFFILEKQLYHTFIELLVNLSCIYDVLENDFLSEVEISCLR